MLALSRGFAGENMRLIEATQGADTCEQVIRDGRIVRPTLGIASAPDEFRQALGLPPGIAIAQPGHMTPTRTAYATLPDFGDHIARTGAWRIGC